MEIQTYLTKRNNVYHFRRRVPKNLISTLGKNEVVRSLKTSDLRTARRAAIIMADELGQLFERIQNGADLLSKKWHPAYPDFSFSKPRKTYPNIWEIFSSIRVCISFSKEKGFSLN